MDETLQSAPFPKSIDLTQQLRPFYYFSQEEPQRFTGLTHNLPPPVLGIVCDHNVLIYRANYTLGQAAQMYLTFEENLQICRPLSQIAQIAGKDSKELARELLQLHSQETPNRGYGISYELNPISEEEIAAALKNDPFVLLNPAYSDAQKFQLSDLPVRRERTDFNVSPRWKPKDILNFGAHSRIVKVSDETGTIACLKVSRYLNDPDQDKRITHEAGILKDIYGSGLWKAGIPRVINSGEGWSVLEYVPGYPARDLLRQFPIRENLHHKGLERNIRLEITRQVAETIYHLHNNCGITHGDITLDNIMMEIIPSGPKATVVDFEYANGDPQKEDKRKDIHMLYETIFEILTGEPPTGKEEQLLKNTLLRLGINQPVSEDLAEHIKHPELISSQIPFHTMFSPPNPTIDNYKTAP